MASGREFGSENGKSVSKKKWFWRGRLCESTGTKSGMRAIWASLAPLCGKAEGNTEAKEPGGDG
jgi:hypothetical protein